MDRRRFLAGAACLSLASPLQAESWSVMVPGGRIDVTMETAPPFDLRLVKTWIQRAADAVSAFYGRFPVELVEVSVQVRPGRKGASGGVTFGSSPPSIRISVGAESTQAHLDSDWVLTHEMVHLALPSLRRRHHWLEEGVATYIEPVARLQAGQIGREQFWKDLVQGLPQGLPGPADRGLDNTATWGRTYWGGALFCFWADLAIRRAAPNACGLQTALRGIVKAGGNIEEEWPIEKVMQVGDAATGTHALVELYDRWKARPEAPDLDKTWEELGIVLRGESIRFEADAPLAAIRESIVRCRP